MRNRYRKKINTFEEGLTGAKQIRSKKFHTRLGTITLKRRAFERERKWVCLADEVLGLPEGSWLLEVDELACALGVTNDFAHAQNLFEKWTRVKVSDHGLSNRIEEIGEELYQEELKAPMNYSLQPAKAGMGGVSCFAAETNAPAPHSAHSRLIP